MAKGRRGKAAAQDAIAVKAQKGQEEARLAEVAYDPAVRALGAGRKFVASLAGERGLQECFNALKAKIATVGRGDLSGLERTLVSQADTLDAIFNDMARRAALNAGQYLAPTELYMKLALRAQSQCRATIETLAVIKNPPIVIAKQANVTTGPQQINNGVAAPPVARGENYEIENQPHVPCVMHEREPAMLSEKQEVGQSVQGSCGEGVERVPIPRGEGRSPERKG